MQVQHGHETPIKLFNALRLVLFRKVKCFEGACFFSLRFCGLGFVSRSGLTRRLAPRKAGTAIFIAVFMDFMEQLFMDFIALRGPLGKIVKADFAA